MFKTLDCRGKVGQVGWLWTAAALLPLALVGCQPKQPVVSQSNSPQERVAGERQEQGDSETMRVIQEGSLPQAFAFGGRTWKAHQVHWVNPDKKADASADTSGATGTTSTEAAPGAPGTTSPTAKLTDDDKGPGGFVPVATFTVNGHQIYRRSDADEAVTDNIYIRADNVRRATTESTGTPATDATGTGTSGAADSAGGAPGTTDTTGAEGTTTTTDTSTQTAFVEYDADENIVDNVELGQLLQVTGLPQTVQHGGKTWKADEVQVYDPDVFDDLKAAPQNIDSHMAFTGDDKDHLWLQAELDPTMLKTTANTDKGVPGTDTASAPSTDATEDAAVHSKGPIFIEYEAQ